MDSNNGIRDILRFKYYRKKIHSQVIHSRTINECLLLQPVCLVYCQRPWIITMLVYQKQ